MTSATRIRMLVSDGTIRLVVAGPVQGADTVARFADELRAACSLAHGTVLIDLTSCTAIAPAAEDLVGARLAAARSSGRPYEVQIVCPQGRKLLERGNRARRTPHLVSR